MVNSTTITTTETRTRMAMKANTTATPTAAPAPAPDVLAGGRRDGSQACPFQRHRRSSESAGLQAEPSHHQNPAREQEVRAAGAVAVPRPPPNPLIVSPPLLCRAPPRPRAVFPGP